jgi:RNA polymerase sigma-70 factor (ECF subfamily)
MLETSTEFSDLLTMARQGDANAIRQVVERYEHIIRRTAHALLGPQMRPYLDSLDIVQSVHRSLLIGLRHEKFDITSPGNLIALALTMVRRKVSRHWRKIQRLPRALPPTGDDSRPDLDQLAGSAADTVTDVAFNEQVRKFLNELEPVDRQLVELRLQGHSTADVARKLGVDSRFLRVRLGRLRKRLREQGLLEQWL